MNTPNEITYKNTLYIATALFVFLMCAATSSLSLEHKLKAELSPAAAASEIVPLGRFIVTPSSARYVDASAASQVELTPQAIELRTRLQGVL